jgi:hypothetical protein
LRQGASPERDHAGGRGKKLLTRPDVSFAFRLAGHLGERDPFALLDDMPERLLTYWQAWYLLEPWDWANKKALADSGYRPPRELTAAPGGKNGRFMTRRDVLDAVRRARL